MKSQTIPHTLFINGNWKKGEGELFCSTNPATDELLWEGTAATEEEVDQAIHAAEKALPSWKNSALGERIAYLERFQTILESEKTVLATLISMETGKPLWESILEVETMIGKVPLSIEAYELRCSVTQKKQAMGELWTRHKPLGVVAVLGPFNFPGHIPNGHIVPALLAGNCIIFKPSEITPRVAEFMIECWERAGIPKGVLNLVQGGKETGVFLAQHPRINALFFTGSYRTGKALSIYFGNHPDKLLALEMGGNNPLIVHHISNLEAAVYMTIHSAYITAGQRCSCARRLIIPKGREGDQFIELLTQAIHRIVIGRYDSSPEPFMGSLIHQQAAFNVLEAQEHLIHQGGNPLIKASPLDLGAAFISPGLIDVTSIAQREDEEIFGPLLQLVRVSDFPAAIKEANATAFGLTSSILTDDPEKYQLFYQSIKAGIINWNVPSTGASGAAPFGGIGYSGNYRPSGYYAADYCSYPTASMENPTVAFPKKLSPGLDVK